MENNTLNLKYSWLILIQFKNDGVGLKNNQKINKNLEIEIKQYHKTIISRILFKSLLKIVYF